MLIKVINRVVYHSKRYFNGSDRFLREVSGLVHVGANTGQERKYYARLGMDVIWIEPIPAVFNQLTANINEHPKQKAFQYLITDHDDKEYQFHIANNDGASSSILDFQHHKEVWPDIVFAEDITLRSTTLSTFFELEIEDLSLYQALILDTQGSEMLVLKGAEKYLRNFTFIKTEIPDFESYVGCATLIEMEAFLKQRGFQEYSREKFAERKAGGSYFDIVYKRISEE